jgi:predicted DNA-binding ribbon-helix-helix protein
LLKSIIKRSVVIAGHATSVSLEPEFWAALRDISVAKNVSVAALIRQIDENLTQTERENLSSEIRVFILKYFRKQIK